MRNKESSVKKEYDGKKQKQQNHLFIAVQNVNVELSIRKVLYAVHIIVCEQRVC